MPLSLRLQITNGLKWQALQLAGRQLLGFVIFTTLARLLDPPAFGLVALVAVYLFFVGLFAEQGVGTAIVVHPDITTEHLDTAYWSAIVFALSLCAATMLFARPVSVMLGERELVPLLRWSSIGLVFSAAAGVHNAVLVRELDFRSVAIRALLAHAVGGAVAIVLALLGFGVWALVVQQLVSAVVGSAYLHAVSSYKPSFHMSARCLRELLGTSSSIVLTNLLWFLSSRLDQIVIGRTLGPSILGVYVVGARIPEMAKLITHQAVAEVSLPALSRLQHDYAQLRQAIYRGMELNALVSFAVFVGTALVGQDLVGVLFGDKWQAAGRICALLAIYGLVNTLQVFFHPALLASGGVGRYVLLNVCHLGGVAIACIIGARSGLTALIAGLIVNGLIMAIPALVFLKHRIGLSSWLYCRPCVHATVASAGMACTIWAGDSLLAALPLTLQLPLKVAGGATTYVGLMFALNRNGLVALLDIARIALRRDVTQASGL